MYFELMCWWQMDKARFSILCLFAVLLYLNMQERIRIQTHLEKLREECVKDYLSSNLESIASRQVVSDILRSFLETNNKEFLESITDSILQVKQNNKRLREALQQLQTDYQRFIEEHRVSQSIQDQKHHSKEIGFLQEKLGELKGQFKLKCQHYCQQIEKLQLQIEAQKKTQSILIGKNQQLQQSLIQERQILKEIQQQLQKQRNILKNQREKSINQIQAIELKLKLSFLEKLQQQKQSKEALINEKTRINGEFLRLAENEKRLLLSTNQQLKNQVKECKKQQQKMKQQGQSVLRKLEDSQKQKQKILSNFQVLKEQLVKYRIQSAEILNQNKHLRQRQEQLLIQIKSHSNGMKEQRQLFQKKLEKLLQQNQSLRLFNEQIVSINKKNDSTLDQQAKEISVLMEHQSQLVRALETQKLQRLQAKNFDEQQKAKLQTLLRITQEQVKSLMNYNTMQQRQISRLQQQSSIIKQQSSAQMEAYQTTFQLNMKELQKQLACQKEKKHKCEAIINQLQQQIEGQREKERYYHSYLQQIALLKKKLEINELTKNKILYRPDSSGRIEKINKKTRIFSLLVKISDQNKRLYREHQQIKKWIAEELDLYRQYFNQFSSLLCNQIDLTSKSAHLLAHSCWKNSLSPSNKQTFLNKTMVRKGGALKQQLKAVQERYQTVNIQNRTFTSNISTLLSN